jgi:hypothetical protein
MSVPSRSKMSPLGQILHNLPEMVKIGAIGSLSNADLKENLLGIDPICLLSGASIGISIADVRDQVVRGALFKQDRPLTGSTQAAIQAMIRVFEADFPPLFEGNSV